MTLSEHLNNPAYCHVKSTQEAEFRQLRANNVLGWKACHSLTTVCVQCSLANLNSWPFEERYDVSILLIKFWCPQQSCRRWFPAEVAYALRGWAFSTSTAVGKRSLHSLMSIDNLNWLGHGLNASLKLFLSHCNFRVFCFMQRSEMQK